jgi:hypothetical protein
LPFRAPPKLLKIMAVTKLLENPNPSAEIMVPIKPIMSTVLRPTFSESAALPHAIAVTNWVTVNAACIIPACAAMVESGREGSKFLSW